MGGATPAETAASHPTMARPADGSARCQCPNSGPRLPYRIPFQRRRVHRQRPRGIQRVTGRHAFLKGTRRRPAPLRRAQERARLFEHDALVLGELDLHVQRELGQVWIDLGGKMVVDQEEQRAERVELAG